MAIKRIGILTAGGDAPGMNAAIRSSVRYAFYNKLEVMGIYRGFEGILNGEMALLNHGSVSNIINRGGTVLKTGRCEEFKTEEGQKRAFDILKQNKIDALITIGGDGTYRGAHALSSKFNFPCIGVPGTIDNDVCGTDFTIGSDTAINTALEAIDKIRDTASSLERIFVIEVMGRTSGYIALQVAIGCGAEEVLIPEQKFDIGAMCHDIVKGNLRGKISWIIVTAEGAAKAADIAKAITAETDLETREVVLGHVQRGGAPTSNDRILAARLGVAAVEALLKGESDKAVGVVCDNINLVGLEAAYQIRPIGLDKLYHLIKILT